MTSSVVMQQWITSFIVIKLFNGPSAAGLGFGFHSLRLSMLLISACAIAAGGISAAVIVLHFLSKALHKRRDD